VISISNDTPSRAVACAGSHDVSGLAASGAFLTVTPPPMAPMAPMASVMRQRRLAGPWSEHQGWSVFTGTSSLARKATARWLGVAMNYGHVVRIGDIWDPDPWRSHPG
jgi:hypothetical protein